MTWRRLTWVLATLASALLVGRSAWQLSGSRTRQLFGELVTRVPVGDSLIALTFDDGPTAYTDSVLAQLADLDAPATFFMVGRAMEQHAEVVARVVEAGHELGNHSYSHRRLVLKRPRTIRSEVERTDALIRAAGQEGEIFFRPPYGKRLVGLPLYLTRRDRPTVLWDLEPDTYHRDAAGMVRYVLDRARPGSIILLHVEIASREQGRLALGEIVTGLRARGYRFVTLSRLIAASEELGPRRTSLDPSLRGNRELPDPYVCGSTAYPPETGGCRERPEWPGARYEAQEAGPRSPPRPSRPAAAVIPLPRTRRSSDAS